MLVKIGQKNLVTNFTDKMIRAIRDSCSFFVSYLIFIKRKKKY